MMIRKGIPHVYVNGYYTLYSIVPQYQKKKFFLAEIFK